MGVNVKIPGPLRRLTNGESQADIEVENIRELIYSLETLYPGMKERLMDESENLRFFVNVYVNGEDIRFLQDLDTVTKDGDEVSIVPAVAGG